VKRVNSESRGILCTAGLLESSGKCRMLRAQCRRARHPGPAPRLGHAYRGRAAGATATGAFRRQRRASRDVPACLPGLSPMRHIRPRDDSSFTESCYWVVAKDAALHYAKVRGIRSEGFKMTKTMTRMMAATAALGLVAAPIMAHANTRAAGAAPTYSISNALPGLGRADDGEGQAESGTLTAIIVGTVAAGAIIAGIVVASESGGTGDDNSTPG